MNKIRLYIQEASNELLHKVSWPTWEELQSSLVVVLVASLIFSLVIYAMDLAFSNILSAFYHLFV
ncbi:MAG: preprotein translocase subunit SecE [Sphingobacteriaceae bacterium]|jgi:preprotein translocase subunit SecE|nr:preprotein translocase subunit SecE [Sphingobacteriaceae bacterium]